MQHEEPGAGVEQQSMLDTDFPEVLISFYGTEGGGVEYSQY